MTTFADEVKRREKVAREALRLAFEKGNDDTGAGLFISHHLEEVEAEYWQQHLGTATPAPVRVLDILVLRSHWGDEENEENEDEGMEVFDFTLPDDATDYVISVRFDSAGVVQEIDMES
ncbi:hypothetical protein ACO0LF_27060 [Undibacterium sp. Di27W]|uniref:hypothetical protein n=1 Tax=Undibacterium sp. Di27W TaxID=3413036 RepID=UPI003BF018E5